MGMRHSTVRSFKYAFQGLFTALKREPNLRIHFFIAFWALSLAVILRLNTTEWLLLAFTIFYVITLELLNTVIESVVNLVSPDIQEHAKIAKDVSAACVLIGAIMAVVVGLILFLPKLLMLL